jgi:hypothetical protein
MTVDYQLDPSDLIAFSQEHRRFAPNSLNRIYYFAVLPALGVGLAVISESLTLAMLFTVLYMLSGWVFQSWIQRRYREAVYSNDNIALATRPWRVCLSEEGLTLSCDALVTLYHWPFVQDVFRGSRYIYFVLTPLYRIHIPLRAFTDDEHAKQFLTKAQSYAKK